MIKTQYYKSNNFLFKERLQSFPSFAQIRWQLHIMSVSLIYTWIKMLTFTKEINRFGVWITGGSDVTGEDIR